MPDIIQPVSQVSVGFIFFLMHLGLSDQYPISMSVIPFSTFSNGAYLLFISLTFTWCNLMHLFHWRSPHMAFNHCSSGWFESVPAYRFEGPSLIFYTSKETSFQFPSFHKIALSRALKQTHYPRSRNNDFFTAWCVCPKSGSKTKLWEGWVR